MHGPEGFLTDLAVVLCVAALSSVLFQRLRQPVVLGYLLAGLLVGPQFALPLVSNHDTVHTLSELGVILLMFSLGLEFSVRKLIQLGRRAGLITALDVSVMVWLGFLVGRVFGWSVAESLFAGAVVGISSTMIVARTFEEQRVGSELKDLVYGVLIFQDLFAILLVAVLSAVAQGQAVTAGEVATSVLRLSLFLLALLVVGFLVIPRFLRMVVRSGQRETMLLATVGTCFAVALVAKSFGYSVALGAFLAGTLAAESGEGRILERLVRPLRDMFAAIFFVSVGMMIDPALVVEHAGVILALTAVVVFGKTCGITVAAFLTGSPPKTSLRAGMSLAQIGEFSFLIAGIGLGLGGRGTFLFPIAVGVSVLTTFTTPWMVRASEPLALRIGQALPRRLHDFATLYESWLGHLGKELSGPTEHRHLRRTLLLILVDAFCFTAIVIGVANWQPTLVARAQQWLPYTREECSYLLLGLGALAALPFLIGLIRCVRRLGLLLAREVLPETEGGLELADVPRRALVVGLQMAGLVLIGLPILAVSQPFLPSVPGIGAFVLVLFAVLVYFWVSATRLDDQMRAGAEMIVDLLARQSRSGRAHGAALREVLAQADDLETVPISMAAPCVGRTLAELDLRGRTGATVVCIQRGREGVVFPTAWDEIRGGDVLVLSGQAQGVNEARLLLESGDVPLERAA